jgi:hypothetical protein
MTKAHGTSTQAPRCRRAGLLAAAVSFAVFSAGAFPAAFFLAVGISWTTASPASSRAWRYSSR